MIEPSRSSAATQPLADVFPGDSELATLMRAYDWSSTPLGPVATWPQALKTCLRIMLTSRQPMWLGWGEQLTFLYNDPYRAILGGKHPAALGQPTSVVWHEIWDDIAPRIESVVGGQEGTYDEALLLVMERYGYPEETYYTFSYSPVPDDTGGVGGLFCANTDDTARIISERQVALLRELASGAAEARTIEDACTLSARALATDRHDLPFALIYLIDADAQRAVLAGASGIDPGHPAAPASIALDAPAPWPLARALQSHTLSLTDLDPTDPAFQTDPPTGAWTRPPAQVATIPIAASGQTAVLVAGLNPFRLFDDGYRGFLDLVAGQITTAITNAQAYETERERAEALAALDRAKTAFFSEVSHELRTPLTLLLGPVGDVLDGAAGDVSPPVRRELQVVRRNGLRLLKLVNTLLDFARIEAGRVDAVYQPADLAAVTAELASVFRSAVERAGLTYTVDTPPLPLPIYIDHDMWEKVVLNLLSNAFKFTLNGEIAVRLRWTGEHAVLTVQDTGAGIPPDELPHLFERFHRVRGTRARTQEGTGIGLALVHELVRLHGGSISADSRLGEGTTFTITLPAGAAHLPADRIGGARALASTATGAVAFVEEAQRWQPGAFPTDGVTPDGLQDVAIDVAPTSVAGGLGAHDARILIADDNADMRDYIARLLGQRWRVTAVPDGSAALEAILADPPDLVLTDVMMPGLDGFALLRALRADPRTTAIPVVLLSARAGEEARIEGLEAGADDYLVKPFSARELVARVGAHLELARVREEAAERERRAQAETEAARRRLHDLFMQAPADIAVLSGPEHRFELANPGYQSLVGPRPLLGLGVREALPEIHGQGFFELLDQVYRTGETYVGTENLVLIDRGRDGTLEEEYLNFVYQPSRNAAGQVDGIMVFAYDVTRQVLARREVEQLAAERATLLEREQAARREAEEANRAKDEFLSVLSHELRTPLTPIIGFTEVLRRGTASPERLRSALEVIERSARAQARLVDDLLDVSRILAGKLSLEMETIDLAPVLHAALATVRSSIDAKHLTLNVAFDPNTGLVRGDPQRVQQIAWNLISNAVKFTPEGGRIDVSLYRDGDSACFVVRDSGMGIEPDFLPHIFERFRQADASTTRQFGGLGLGLAIAAHLTERHGGTLTVDSDGPSTGATFTLCLPLLRHSTDADTDLADASGAEDADLPLARRRVLLVEDDPDSRTLLQMLLESAGATVTPTATSAAALAALTAGHPDLIVADIGLPGEDGYGFIGRVRARTPEDGGAIPAVALTAYASPDDRRRALAAGFQQHLAKPVDADALIGALIALAGRHDSTTTRG